MLKLESTDHGPSHFPAIAETPESSRDVPPELPRSALFAMWKTRLAGERSQFAHLKVT
jgi:hypothetical protein